MKNVILGIDTSNYTTSLCLMSEDGELIANLKSPLTVKAGERGLRQSDAVFLHTKNFPELFCRVRPYLDGCKILCVGVSERPRNVSGSYMPCFLSGVAVAEAISASLGVPLYKFSHQCGHIMAALYSAGKIEELSETPFAAFHVSGGTTELLRVSLSENGFFAELVGGTADLNAGQVIDRIGVAMGLSFPAGRELEALALENTAKIPKRKPKLNGLSLNLSGLENMAMKLYSDTSDKALTAAFVFDYIGSGLISLAEAFVEKYGKSPVSLREGGEPLAVEGESDCESRQIKENKATQTHSPSTCRCQLPPQGAVKEIPFVFAGGVMSNSIIKKMLSERLDAYFAEPALSADNAVGIARLALKTHRR